jgi:hypothetical protein
MTQPVWGLIFICLVVSSSMVHASPQGTAAANCRSMVRTLLSSQDLALPHDGGMLFGKTVWHRMEEPEGALFRAGICSDVAPCGEPDEHFDPTAVPASCISVAHFNDAAGRLDGSYVTASSLPGKDLRDGFRVTYAGGAPCSARGGAPRITTLDVLCDPKVLSTTPTVLSVREGSGDSICVYTVELSSRWACPAAPTDEDVPTPPPTPAPVAHQPLPTTEPVFESVHLRLPPLDAVKSQLERRGVYLQGVEGCVASEDAWRTVSCASSGGSLVSLSAIFPDEARLVSASVGGTPCEAAGFTDGSGQVGSTIPNSPSLRPLAQAGSTRVVGNVASLGESGLGTPPAGLWCVAPGAFGVNRTLSITVSLPNAGQTTISVDRAVSYDLAFDPLAFDPVRDLGVGGLTPQIRRLFRRLFASRSVPKYILRATGGSHVRGAMLHGPPGTGKTLLARAMAKFLGAHTTFVAGPEVLSKYVGDSEARVRALFAPAEQEFKQKGDSASLHVLIIDEIDSLLTRRSGPGGDNAPAQRVYDGLVDQFLAKMDGAEESMPNLLVVGLTNRMSVLDPAVLRPGRLEVHVEIPYPSEAGRAEILGLHTESMRVARILGEDVHLPELASMTGGMSGADLAGITRDAGALAMSRAFGSRSASPTPARGFSVTRADFLSAVSTARRVVRQRLVNSDVLIDPVSVESMRLGLQPLGLVDVPTLHRALNHSRRALATQIRVPLPLPLFGSADERRQLLEKLASLEAVVPPAPPPPLWPPRGCSWGLSSCTGPRGQASRPSRRRLQLPFQPSTASPCSVHECWVRRECPSLSVACWPRRCAV